MEIDEQHMEGIAVSVDHELLKTGIQEKIFEELQQQIDVQCISENGDTALHSILRNDKLLQKDVVEFLTTFLDRGVDPNKSSASGETALHLAIERRMQEAVGLLLEYGADRYVVDQSGNGIAHFFIEDECNKMKMAISCTLMNTPENREIREDISRDFVNFMLYVGFDFDRKNEEGKSALHLTIIYNLPHLLPILLESTYVKPNYEELIEILLTEISSTSASHSPDEIHTDTSNYDTTLLMLLDRGQFDNNYGLTFLSTAIKNKREMSCIQTMINYFLIKCDDLDFATNMFEELICTYASWNDLGRDYFSSVLYDLIAQGINTDDENLQKRLVWQAIGSKNTWLLDILQQMGVTFMGLELKNGENLICTIDKRMDYTEESSLEFCRKFVDVLLRNDYNLNSQDRYGKTILQTVMDSVKVPMIQMIIESGVDLNRRDKCGRTALHHAMLTGISARQIEVPMIKPIFRQSRPARLGLPLSEGLYNYLHLQAYRSSLGKPKARVIVEQLVKAGVDLNVRDSMSNTPLHIAVLLDDVEMMKILLEGQVEVNAKDREGDTPLQLILILKRALNSNDMIKLLLKRGARPNVRNMQMETPLELALLYNTEVVVELLRYNAHMEDSNVRQLLQDLNDRDIDPKVRNYYTEVGTFLCMQRHWMKLMAANLPLSNEYRNYMSGRVDRKYYEQCLAEIDELKKVWIDDQLSLYDYLHMHPRGRCAYMQRENVQQIINSPNLIYKFPEISVLVMAGYEEAKLFQRRETISSVVSEIFVRMYNFPYPSISEKIVSFLREDDLLFLNSQ